jgi:hypothetical protein
MSESFIPLAPIKPGASQSNFAPLAGGGQTSKTGPGVAGAPKGPQPCAKPIITLQREGDVVTSVRIQCGCGQIVDLNCVY